MRRFASLCLTLVFVFSAGSVLAQATYRWIHPKTGETMITDTPPPRNAKLLERAQGGGEDPQAGLPYATRRAMEHFPVILYSSADCVAECKDARNLLNKRGIPFTEKVLKTQEDHDELKALVGDVFVPSMKVGTQSVKGFSAESYDSILDLAGYPKTAPYGVRPSGSQTQ